MKGCQECARSRALVTARNAQIAKLNADLDDAYVQVGRLKAELRCKEARIKGQAQDLSQRQGSQLRKLEDNQRDGRDQTANGIVNRLYAGQDIPAEEVPAELHTHPDFILDRETYTIRSSHVVGRQNLGRLLRAALLRKEEGSPADPTPVASGR